MGLLAQEVIFTTEVPENKMGTEDVIHVQYIIQNVQRLDNLVLEPSNDFKVLGQPSQARNINMMNDRVSMSLIYTFSFKPRRTGRLNFPIAIATIRGRKIRSKQVGIDAVKGRLVKRRPQRRQQMTDPFANDPWFQEMQRMQDAMMAQQRQLFGQSPSGRSNGSPRRGQKPLLNPNDQISEENIDDHLFIRAEVDKTDVHIGEQITVSYKLYSRLKAHMSLKKLPESNNFWKEVLDIPAPPVPRREVLNGKEYNVLLLKKTALFPLKTGELTIDPVVMEGRATLRKAVPVKRRNPFGRSIDEGYHMVNELQEINLDDKKSNTVTVNVKDFPVEDRPEHFTDAVGSFDIESKISATELTTDDVATLTVTIRGNGNIKLLEAPKLLLPDSIVELFEPIEFDTITSKAKDRVTGYKKITYRFSPKGTGELKVPPISLAYYNADAERYEVKSTSEYTVRVRPGKVRKKGGFILPMYIHDITSENMKLQKDTSTILPEQMWYWGAYLLPTFGFLFLLGFRRREEHEQKDKVRFKNKRANKVALNRLNKAENHRKANEHIKFYEETSKAVWLYLSDKLNIPLSTLSKEMAGTLLRKKEISQELVDELFLITDECELALYAPEAGDFKMNQVYSDSLRLIGTLEDKLG